MKRDSSEEETKCALLLLYDNKIIIIVKLSLIYENRELLKTIYFCNIKSSAKSNYKHYNKQE